MKRNLFILIIVLTAICGDTAAQDLKEKVSNYFQLHTAYPQEKL